MGAPFRSGGSALVGTLSARSLVRVSFRSHGQPDESERGNIWWPHPRCGRRHGGAVAISYAFTVILAGPRRKSGKAIAFSDPLPGMLQNV